MVKRVFFALRYSLAGLGAAFKHEAAFRSDLALVAVLVIVAICLPVSLTAKALLIVSALAVLVVELLNSCIECAIDYISQKTHPMAKRAKDMGSAAVFLSLVCVAVVWALVLWDAWG